MAFDAGAPFVAFDAGPLSGPEALRRYASDVLLQRDAAAATAVARDAARSALDIARSCLADNDPAAAVQALDACRGLILFAATEFRDVTARLDAAGRHDLSERWRLAAHEPGGAPAELRDDILGALAAALDTTGGGPAGLLDPPTLPEIRAALAALDTDALVYLVPGASPAPGWAVMVGAGGWPAAMRLPDLVLDRDVDRDVDVQRLPAALSQRDLDAVLDGPAKAGGLDTLCDWAWRAAVGPIVERYLPSLPSPGKAIRGEAALAAYLVPFVLLDRWGELFGAKFDVLLYDLTSTYFESDPPPATSDKRRHWLQPRQARRLRAGGDRADRHAGGLSAGLRGAAGQHLRQDDAARLPAQDRGAIRQGASASG